VPGLVPPGRSNRLSAGSSGASGGLSVPYLHFCGSFRRPRGLASSRSSAAAEDESRRRWEAEGAPLSVAYAPRTWSRRPRSARSSSIRPASLSGMPRNAAPGCALSASFRSQPVRPAAVASWYGPRRPGTGWPHSRSGPSSDVRRATATGGSRGLPGLPSRRVRSLAGMDRPKRRNMILDLRVIDEKIALWLGAEDLDSDDRHALEVVRDLITDLITRPG
jgi:hypothetical protein